MKTKQKWKLKTTTDDGLATLTHWSQHLYRSYILSVIPLLSDGTCWFACIDYDKYELDYIKICHDIAALKFPLLPVVSKSAGLHLFVFFKEPVKAELVIPALHYWAARLGFEKKDYEVFPTSAGEDKFTRAIWRLRAERSTSAFSPIWRGIGSSTGQRCSNGCAGKVRPAISRSAPCWCRAK